MIKPIIPIGYSATQNDIDSGLFNTKTGGYIMVVDANGSDTGKRYEVGASGSAPVEAGGIKNNLAATTAPTVNDDSGDGFSIGSRWIDTTNDESYICLDATVGSAVWSKTTVSTIGEVAGLQTALDGKSATSHAHTGTYEPSNSNIQSHVTAAHAPSTAEQNVNADWNAASGDAQILNKPATDFTDWTSYTPVVSTESGGWTNYTATGRYRIVNRMLTVSFRIQFTGTPAAASGMYVGLPSGLTMNASVMTGGAGWDADLVGFGVLGDSGTISGVPAIITTRTNQKIIVKYYSWNGTYITCPGFGNTTPWSWAWNDTIDGQFTVPIL